MGVLLFGLKVSTPTISTTPTSHTVCIPSLADIHCPDKLVHILRWQVSLRPARICAVRPGRTHILNQSFPQLQ